MNDVKFTIVDKEGKTSEELTFNNFDSLADHMMDVAIKWYEGVYDPDDTLKIERFDENGQLVLAEERKFGEEINDEFDASSFDLNLPPLPEDFGTGDGGEVRKGRGKPKGFG